MTTTGDNFDPVQRTARISWEIRESLRKALPAPAEQFFTVMVPGKVINFADYSEGFDADGKPTGPILPTVTELNNAILCDDMPALAPVQLGPTGKSVARSYDAAISKFVPAGTTVGVDVVDPNNLTTDEARYKKAMEWLTYQDSTKEAETRVQIYAEKQFAYTKAVEDKAAAFSNALKRAMDDPRNITIEDKREAYDQWVSENARTYRNFMQAAYMDWVVTGNKEEVEYWFSVVDRDSAMARVEASKEAMRAAIVQDTDGSVEYQKVKLTPSNWAVIAKNKAISGKSQTRTVEWYTWEIARLQKMNSMLTALRDKQPITPTPSGSETNTDQQLNDAMVKLVDKREVWQRTASDKDTSEDQKKTAYDEYREARKVLTQAESDNNKKNIQGINALSQAAQAAMYNSLQGNTGLAATLIADNSSKIDEYVGLRDALLNNTGGNGNIIVTKLADDVGIPKPLADPASAPAFNTVEDYFTAISIEISSSSSQESASSHATSASFGGSVGWGLWSAGLNSSYSSGSSDAASSMAKNSCKVSFECMRVDIQRSWLRAELFYDADLTTGPAEFISPGFGKLRDLMEGNTDSSAESVERELERYSTFPLYPTAFLLAANVVLEITGETTAIQSHFQTSSVSAGGSFGYGPFTVSSSYSSSNQSSDASCEATADGCRITIKSPQIIGWVSQMVPALPRLSNQPLP